MASEENHRELVDLPGLNQREGLEQLIQGTEAAGEDDERHRVLDEHRLPHEEVAEVDEAVDVGVGTLLEGKLDIAADGLALSLAGALVRGLHDAGAGAGDDREARLGKELRRFLRGTVLRIIRTSAGRSEDRDSLLHRGEGVEALDELAHDP